VRNSRDIVRSNLDQKILEFAKLLISGFGFKKVTMEDIAREANVARATIYLHFRNQQEIGLAGGDRMHFR
jgi:AcrR family transcriptional regulator